ncbi:MAG: KpsF/GutQ family sugar-phosphate isomerase [Candidatus Methylacidiphilales bacterium]|nr:KpsF/GutQ family sugar-phosphate isomerase [Candidatus Methylacidiphilales bacterium]
MRMRTRARKVIDLEIAGLRALRAKLDPSFDLAVTCLMETCRRGGKVIVVGVGKSGHIGDKIAATLTSTGCPAVVLNALNATHGDLGVVGKADVILALSFSGETEELLRILPSLKRAASSLVGITGNARSSLARNADIHLHVPVSREACPLNLAPTTSTTAMLVLGDALAMVLLEARGFKKEEFARFHPGGSLGRNLLLGIRDVMRPIEQVAVCRENTPVRDALAEITRKRCGAAIIINSRGTLAGIYTQGDFTRGYQKSEDVGRLAVGKVMTAKPIRVQVDKLAVDVLNILSRHKINDLPVVDRRNHPVGLIDVQDLTKVKLL